MLRLTFLMTVAALLLSASATPATQAFVRATADRTDDRPGPQVHIVYAVPADGTDNALDTDGTLVDSVAVWEEWFVEQTGDRVLRLDTYQGNADVTFLRLPFTAQQIANAAPNELSRFRSALGSVGLNNPTKEYAVYYDGASSVVPNCGRGGSLLAVVYLKNPGALNCTPLPFRHPGQSAAYREFIMVHELLHGLGMVPTCAPHWTSDNHVAETNDVMTGGIIGNSQQLDVGRDDYFRAHVPGCTDLADSAYLAAPPPGRPGGASAVAGDHEATVSFTPATGTVTSYTVTSTPGGVTAAGQASPITVTGLTNGVSYTFVVTAKNGAEPGAASAPTNPITPNTPPGAPTDAVATAGDGQATVSFTPPSSSGDSPIEHYTVTASPGGQSAVGAASPITVSGLQNGSSTPSPSRPPTRSRREPASAPSNPVIPTESGRTLVAPPTATLESRRPRRRRAAGRPAPSAAAPLIAPAEGTFRPCRPPPRSPSSAPPRWR